MMRAIAIAATLLSVTVALAETNHPNGGEDAGAIKALPNDRIKGLRQGAGLGFAKAAELNGWPGPLHILELAADLELAEDVRDRIEEIRIKMLAEAQALGSELIAAEDTLDALFAEGAPDAAAIEAATAEAGMIEGRLRAAHLIAHMEAAPLLSRHQRAAYAKLRGYSGGHGDHIRH